MRSKNEVQGSVLITILKTAPAMSYIWLMLEQNCSIIIQGYAKLPA
jgi:hypothetical protein